MPDACCESPNEPIKDHLRQEHGFVCAVIVLHLLLISLPYLWAYFQTADGQNFGGLLGNIEDQNVHLSWARQAADGAFVFRNLFTTEGISGPSSHFTNLLCVAMGVISKTLSLPLILVYHALRVIFAALTLWWFYQLCVLLTPSRRTRLLAVALAAFASGMGWIWGSFAWWGEKPFDTPGSFLMPEAFTFTSAFFFPMFIAPIALLALTFALILKTLDHSPSTPLRTGRLVLGAGFASFLLVHIHPYDALPLVVALLLWVAWEKIAHFRRKQNALHTAWIACAVVIAASSAAAQQWFALQTPAFHGAAQFVAPPPKPVYLLLTYGVFLPLAVYGAWKHRHQTGARLMACWALACLTCIYLPFPVAGKLIEGSHLPLCFLAAIAVADLTRATPRRWQIAITAGVLGLLSISSVHIVVAVLQETQEPLETRFKHLRPPVYFSKGQQQALGYLNARPPTEKTAAVLCLPHLGNYVPRESGMYVYVGHPAYTLNFQEKFQRTLAFYQGLAPADEAKKWLSDNSIVYVLEGPQEKLWVKMQSGRLPSQQLALKPVFHSGDTDIYAAR